MNVLAESNLRGKSTIDPEDDHMDEKEPESSQLPARPPTPAAEEQHNTVVSFHLAPELRSAVDALVQASTSPIASPDDPIEANNDLGEHGTNAIYSIPLPPSASDASSVDKQQQRQASDSPLLPLLASIAADQFVGPDSHGSEAGEQAGGMEDGSVSDSGMVEMDGKADPLTRENNGGARSSEMTCQGAAEVQQQRQHQSTQLQAGHGHSSTNGNTGEENAVAGPSTMPAPVANKSAVTTKKTREAGISRRKVEARFACPIEGCESTFTRSHNLAGHLRSHQDERPFKCGICGRGFARQHDCKRHARLHQATAQRLHECPGCHRRFARADGLMQHRMRTDVGKECGRPQASSSPIAVPPNATAGSGLSSSTAAVTSTASLATASVTPLAAYPSAAERIYQTLPFHEQKIALESAIVEYVRSYPSFSTNAPHPGTYTLPLEPSRSLYFPFAPSVSPQDILSWLAGSSFPDLAADPEIHRLLDSIIPPAVAEPLADDSVAATATATTIGPPVVSLTTTTEPSEVAQGKKRSFEEAHLDPALNDAGLDASLVGAAAMNFDGVDFSSLHHDQLHGNSPYSTDPGIDVHQLQEVAMAEDGATLVAHGSQDGEKGGTVVALSFRRGRKKPNRDHPCEFVHPETREKCGKAFARAFDLKRHQETVHLPEEAHSYHCYACGKVFSRQDALTRHRRTLCNKPGRHTRHHRQQLEQQQQQQQQQLPDAGEQPRLLDTPLLEHHAGEPQEPSLSLVRDSLASQELVSTDQQADTLNEAATASIAEVIRAHAQSQQQQHDEPQAITAATHESIQEQQQHDEAEQLALAAAYEAHRQEQMEQLSQSVVAQATTYSIGAASAEVAAEELQLSEATEEWLAEVAAAEQARADRAAAPGGEGSEGVKGGDGGEGGHGGVVALTA